MPSGPGWGANRPQRKTAQSGFVLEGVREDNIATWKRDRILGNVSSFGVGGPPCQDPVGVPYLTAPAQAAPSQSSAAAGTVGSFGWLRALLEGCGLVAKLDSAITWCDGQDVDSLAMLKEIEMEDELVKELGLKPGKQKQLRMRIKNAEA